LTYVTAMVGSMHSNTSEEPVYMLPSQLHRWFLLFNSAPTELHSASILEFAVEVIARFSPRLLSTERRIGPGSIQRPPEAQAVTTTVELVLIGPNSTVVVTRIRMDRS
jgi:hypothetical protein